MSKEEEGEMIIDKSVKNCSKCGKDSEKGEYAKCLTKLEYFLCTKCYKNRSNIGLGKENWIVKHTGGKFTDFITEKEELLFLKGDVADVCFDKTDK